LQHETVVGIQEVLDIVYLSARYRGSARCGLLSFSPLRATFAQRQGAKEAERARRFALPFLPTAPGWAILELRPQPQQDRRSRVDLGAGERICQSGTFIAHSLQIMWNLEDLLLLTRAQGVTNQPLELLRSAERGAIVTGIEPTDSIDERLLARVACLQGILAHADEDLIRSACARPVEFEFGRGFLIADVMIVGRKAVRRSKDQEEEVAVFSHTLTEIGWRGNVGELLRARITHPGNHAD
jgi:hypothetical protein